ncbi:unnamed protein product [Polarella glacialis]|uniref:Uncharacterized protein n=1 Tax=Polarella glacialis TaxID=89957 RepID=A0A813KUM8_POLGL|nr:unnamed protein product [Polarella glacialis]
MAGRPIVKSGTKVTAKAKVKKGAPKAAQTGKSARAKAAAKAAASAGGTVQLQQQQRQQQLQLQQQQQPEQQRQQQQPVCGSESLAAVLRPISEGLGEGGYRQQLRSVYTYFYILSC